MPSYIVVYHKNAIYHSAECHEIICLKNHFFDRQTLEILMKLHEIRIFFYLGLLRKLVRRFNFSLVLSVYFNVPGTQF